MTTAEADAGFGTHRHRDIESAVLSYVLESALEHKVSSGGGA